MKSPVRVARGLWFGGLAAQLTVSVAAGEIAILVKAPTFVKGMSAPAFSLMLFLLSLFAAFALVGLAMGLVFTLLRRLVRTVRRPSMVRSPEVVPLGVILTVAVCMSTNVALAVVLALAVTY